MSIAEGGMEAHTETIHTTTAVHVHTIMELGEFSSRGNYCRSTGTPMCTGPPPPQCLHVVVLMKV